MQDKNVTLINIPPKNKFVNAPDDDYIKQKGDKNVCQWKRCLQANSFVLEMDGM